MMMTGELNFSRCKISLWAYQDYLRCKRFIHQVGQVPLRFIRTMGNKFLRGVNDLLLAKNQFIVHRIMQSRKPALLRLQHGAYQDAFEPVAPEFLFFCPFTKQWNKFMYSDL